MGVVFYNGQLLFRNGALAMSTACCCEGACTDCPAGQPTMGDPHTLPVVNTLYARITNVENCACLDGLCIPLAWNGVLPGHQDGAWQGTLEFLDCLDGVTPRYITLGVSCCGSLGFHLGSDFCTAGATPTQGYPCPNALTTPFTNAVRVDAGWSCRPYNMTWANFGIQGCCNGISQVITITVTETAC